MPIRFGEHRGSRSSPFGGGARMNEHRVREFKNYAEGLKDPLKTLILSSPDSMPDDQLVSKFIEWRKLLRLSKKETTKP